MKNETVAEWRGSVSADLRNITASCERIEGALIAHGVHDDERFESVAKQHRWLLAKVAGLMVLAGTGAAALIQ